MAMIFYGDGSTCSDLNDPPHQNVQAIVQQTEHDGWHIRSGSDWYIKVKDEWIGVDIYGALDYLMAKGFLLQGRTIPNADYAAIMKKAIQYRDTN